MKMEVYHLQTAQDAQAPMSLILGGSTKLVREVLNGKWPSLSYQSAAIVESRHPDTWDCLEQAFHDTNHIDIEWWRNENVTRLNNARRSTSVGDYVKTDDGKLYAVMGCGFQEIE